MRRRPNENTSSQGRKAEDEAARFLEKQGYTIVERNYRTRWGEIDIVAAEGKVLCFVEVKSRRSHASGTAAEAVTLEKQRKIAFSAETFLQAHKSIARRYKSYRFDVVAFDEEKCTLYKGAFEISGGHA